MNIYESNYITQVQCNLGSKVGIPSDLTAPGTSKDVSYSRFKFECDEFGYLFSWKDLFIQFCFFYSSCICKISTCDYLLLVGDSNRCIQGDPWRVCASCHFPILSAGPYSKRFLLSLALRLYDDSTGVVRGPLSGEVLGFTVLLETAVGELDFDLLDSKSHSDNLCETCFALLSSPPSPVAVLTSLERLLLLDDFE